MSEQRELKEFEWYLRDHFFRQSNKGITRFENESLAQDMVTLYLRYRNYGAEKINQMLEPVLKNLKIDRVITATGSINSDDDINSFKLLSQLRRLQCSACFYISYLGENEQKNCSRCSSDNLHDFPSPMSKKKV